MRKKSIKKFGKTRFFLGIRKEDGKEVFLTKASWDCDWHYGFGYVNTFEKNDIYDHMHFDDLFLKKDIFYSFKNYFKETPLTDKEIWILLGYMKEFYVMKEYSKLLHCGNYITNNAISILEDKNKESNLKEYNRINKILLPELFKKIYKLLDNEV